MKFDYALDKNLPQAVEAERLVLGCILLANETLSQAAEKLNANDFFLRSHGRIFNAMIALAAEGRAIDPITLQELLRQSGDLESIGGTAYIASLFDGVPRFSNIENYVGLVKDKSVTRRLISIGSLIMNNGLDDERDASEQLAIAKKILNDIDDPADNSRWLSIDSAAENWREDYRARKQSGRKYDGLATGFGDLDEHLSGISKGDITLIGARPRIGKTALLTAIAEKAVNSPHNRNLVVGIFSMELSHRQWLMRWESSMANVRLSKIRACELTTEDFRDLKRSREIIQRLPIYIDDQTNLTPNRFRAAMERLKKDHPGCEYLAIIDYLQMMRSDHSGISEKRLVLTHVAERMKETIKDYLDCYCIAAASLNRESEARKDKEPELSDLRECGDLESVAATVMMLHRPALYRPNYQAASNEEVIVKIEKARFAAQGRVSIGFDPTCVRYGDFIKPAPSSYSWRDDAQD